MGERQNYSSSWPGPEVCPCSATQVKRCIIWPAINWNWTFFFSSKHQFFNVLSLSDLCRNCTAIIFLLTLLVDFSSSCRVSKRPVPRNEKPTAITTPPVVKKRRYVFLIFGSCFNLLQSAQLVALSRCIELYQLALQGEFLISAEGKTKLRNVCLDVEGT